MIEFRKRKNNLFAMRGKLGKTENRIGKYNMMGEACSTMTMTDVTIIGSLQFRQLWWESGRS